MIVVDCSVVVDVLVQVEGSASVVERLSKDELHVPGLVDYELVSALRSLVARGVITTVRAYAALEDYDALPLERWRSSGGLRRRAIEMRANLTAYDAACVTLAEALGCPLLIRDRRLSRATGHTARIEVC